jgi:hypothetical protein
LSRLRSAFTGMLMLCLAAGAAAQEAQPAPPADDTRTQFPAFMRDSYVSLRVGYIGYLFTATQLEPGFVAASIERPRPAVRLDFFGHHFTKNLSAQVTYMRPGQFVEYNDINGKNGNHPVSNAYAGLTFSWEQPLTSAVDWYLEGGYGITSRSGIVIDGQTALEPAHYGSALVGGGLTFHWTPTADIMLGATYSPGRQAFNQPSTRIYTTGVRYNLRPISAPTVIENRDGGNFFPTNILRVGYSTNLLGYGVNDVFSKWVVIFWGGHVDTKQGGSIEYERNVFHTKKLFAFDLGVSASIWQTDATRHPFSTVSAYPLARFFLIRNETADTYFSYSIAGPTYISEYQLDDLNTGASFTFQDMMGVGAFLGKSRRLNAEISIKHFSNGNLATSNAGIKIPLTFKIGLVF